MTASASLLFRVGSARPAAWLAAIAGALTAIVAVALVEDNGVVLCPFRIVSGGAYCPGCGASRAVAYLVRGDIGRSWTAHPIILLVAIQALAIGVYAVALSLRGTIPKIPWTAVIGANAAALLLIWTLRTATGSIPTLW